MCAMIRQFIPRRILLLYRAIHQWMELRQCKKNNIQCYIYQLGYPSLDFSAECVGYFTISDGMFDFKWKMDEGFQQGMERR